MKGKLGLTPFHSGSLQRGIGRCKRKGREGKERQGKEGRQGMDVDKSIQRNIFPFSTQNISNVMEMLARKLVVVVAHVDGNQ